MENIDVMTIDEAAAVLRMNPNVVLSYFKSGRLRGWREPGSGERRVAMHHLIDFMREYGLPEIEESGGVAQG